MQTKRELGSVRAFADYADSRDISGLALESPVVVVDGYRILAEVLNRGQILHVIEKSIQRVVVVAVIVQAGFSFNRIADFENAARRIVAAVG